MKVLEFILGARSNFCQCHGHVVALQRAEMRMVRWIRGVKLKDRLPSKELRERLGVDDSVDIAYFTVLTCCQFPDSLSILNYYRIFSVFL